MTTYPVVYTAKIWDELDNKEQIVSGITFGRNMREVGENLDRYYGDLLLSVTTTFLEETSCPIKELPNEIASKILSDNNI